MIIPYEWPTYSFNILSSLSKIYPNHLFDLVEYDESGANQVYQACTGAALPNAFSNVRTAHSGSKKLIGLSNKVVTGNGVLYIPMLDMNINNCNSRAEWAILLQNIVKYTGNIYRFNSGNAEHLWGDQLIPYELWIELLGKTLLAEQGQSTPLVDVRWIGHCLLKKHSILRLTANSNTHKPYVPSIIEVLNISFIKCLSAPKNTFGKVHQSYTSYGTP